MSRTHRSPGYALLLGLGLIVVLGHVCVLPADAAGLATLVGHAHGAHDEPSADESVHRGSCEAVRSAFTVATPILSVTPAASVRPIAHDVRRSLERPLPAVASSPPLFLLHASLLI